MAALNLKRVMTVHLIMDLFLGYFNFDVCLHYNFCPELYTNKSVYAGLKGLRGVIYSLTVTSDTVAILCCFYLCQREG
jgi:hypothetical protein